MIYKINSKRPLSWSQISSFEYDKNEWFKKYVLGEKQDSNTTMDFGKRIGERLASDPLFLPEVPRYEIFEKKFTARIGKLNLIAFLDSFQRNPMAILEYKTSSNINRWTQESAEEHGQILFYLACCWLVYGVPAEYVKCNLIYIPVKENGSFDLEIDKTTKIQNFEVRHTSKEVLKFLNYILKTVDRMKEFVKQKNREAAIDQSNEKILI